jgi:hypothetical protein
MPLLTAKQFEATYGEPPQRVGAEEAPPFNFWLCFQSIPAADFEGHDCSAGRVEYAYRMPPGRFEHALVCSEDRNVYMVLVLDREAGVVYGHRLLDLNREYGLDA